MTDRPPQSPAITKVLVPFVLVGTINALVCGLALSRRSALAAMITYDPVATTGLAAVAATVFTLLALAVGLFRYRLIVAAIGTIVAGAAAGAIVSIPARNWAITGMMAGAGALGAGPTSVLLTVVTVLAVPRRTTREAPSPRAIWVTTAIGIGFLLLAGVIAWPWGSW